MTKETALYPPIAPVFLSGKQVLVADALLMFSIPIDRLGPVVASLADDEHSDKLIAAIDAVVGRACS